MSKIICDFDTAEIAQGRGTDSTGEMTGDWNSPYKNPYENNVGVDAQFHANEDDGLYFKQRSIIRFTTPDIQKNPCSVSFCGTVVGINGSPDYNYEKLQTYGFLCTSETNWETYILNNTFSAISEKFQISSAHTLAYQTGVDTEFRLTFKNVTLKSNTTYYIFLGIDIPGNSCDHDEWILVGQGDFPLSIILNFNSSSVHIDNGSTIEEYRLYIDDGSKWNSYSAHIHNGTSWEVYN